MLPKTLLFVLSILCVSVLQAESEVKLIYPVDGTDYEVVEVHSSHADVRAADGGEKRLLLLTDEAGNFPLRLDGEFDIDLDYAWPLTNYEITRYSKSYSNYSKIENSFNVKVSFRFIGQLYPWNSEKLKSGIILVGWVSDSGIELIGVGASTGRYKAKRNPSCSFVRSVKGEGISGFPVAWLLVDRALSKRDKVNPVEGAALGLMDRTYSANKRDSEGNTALHLAAMNGHSTLVKDLSNLWKKKSFLENADGSTALLCGARNGRVEIVDTLSSRNYSLNRVNDLGKTAISVAARNGHIEVVDRLIYDGAKFKEDSATRVGSVALYNAINEKHEEIAISLLEKGATVNYRKKSGKRGIAFKCFVDGNPRLGFALMDEYNIRDFRRKNNLNGFHAIAGYADPPLLEQMLARGMEVSQVSIDGLLPMDYAISTGNVPAICWFVERGGNVSIEGRKRDPVSYAVGNGQLDSITCLLNYGYDVNVELQPGVTAMMKAIFLGHREIAEALYEAGGAWSLESEAWVTYCLIRAIETDSVVLLKAAGEQGYALDTLLFGEWSIATVAKFFGADSIMEAFAWTASEEESGLLETKDLDLPLTNPLRDKLPYPSELANRFGNRDIEVVLGVDKSGIVRLFDFKEGTPSAICSFLVDEFERLNFGEPVSGGIRVSTYLSHVISLRAKTLEEMAYEVDELDVVPGIVRQVVPKIPFSMYSSGIKGEVLLEWIVDPQGNSKEIQILETSHPAFAYPAFIAIQKSRFSPGEKDGKKVPARVTQKILFNRK